MKKLDNQCIRIAKEQLSREGYADMGKIISPDMVLQFKERAIKLVEDYGKDRNFKMKDTDNTLRKLRNVPCEIIKSNHKELVDFYSSEFLIQAMTKVCDDVVEIPAYEHEQIQIVSQSEARDTHGWHWGDYSYILILMLESPPKEYGGLLQCVPHTSWNKERSRIIEYLIENKISTYYNTAGAAYLLKADTTLHRTTPLEISGKRRTIIRLGFSGTNNRRKKIDHGTLDTFFGEELIEMKG
ncbi:MAG: ArpA protein [Symploca sp. SIO2E6]|nr:ArpA protein [Symploca sp. SIO2E6]